MLAALTLASCSALVTDEEVRAAQNERAGGSASSRSVPAFDLTTKNLEDRPHIEAVPEAVEALAESGFTPVQAGKLTVAINGAGTPPTAFFAEDDAATVLGSDADFASLIAHGLGLEFAPENVAWADWPLGVESGKYDIVLSNVGVTEERKELFDFASYRDAVMGFIVSKQSEITEISEPADVAGLKVIVGSGTNQEKFLLDWFSANAAEGLEAGTPVYYDDPAAGLLALTSGRADASIQPYSAAKFQAESLGDTRVVGKFNSAFPVEGEVGAATARGNGLIAPVQIVVQHLIETGVYGDVLDHWGQSDEAITTSRINPPGLPKP